MALGANTKRIQLTLNADKPNDKLILDFLENCYDKNGKIKEILYSAIVSQGYSPLQTVSNSKERILIESNSDERLLTKPNYEELKDTMSNDEEQKETETNYEQWEETESESNLDDGFDDVTDEKEVVEIKETKLERAKRIKKLNNLK